MKRKCQFIGIGVQKSASTWVHRILEDHPQITSSSPKELDFFSFNFSKGEDWYHSHFSCDGEYNSNVLCGEISPSYFNDAVAPKRVNEYNPDIKIIVTLRDPFDRAYSNHLHLIRDKRFPFENINFENGLKNFPEYIDQSMYFKHLSLWYSFFPKKSFLILLQEEIRVDPVSSARAVYEFLGIDGSHESNFIKREANVSFQPKYKSLDFAYKFIARSLNRLGLERVVKFIKTKQVFLMIRDKNRLHLSQKVPKVPNEVKQSVMSGFETDLTNLSKLIGRDSFPWETWKQSQDRKL